MNEFNEFYNKISKYTKVNSFRLRAISELSECTKDTVVYDLGCGEGIIGKFLKDSYGCGVYGFDVSTLAVAKAKNLLNDARECDLNNFVIPSDLPSPQLVVISEVLEHLFAPEKLLSSLHDGIDSGATLIVSVPNILFWKNRLKLLLGDFNYTDGGLMDRGHIHFFSWQSFLKLLKECGFKIIESRHHQPTRFMRPLANLFPGLSSFQFIVKIKKI
jgi:predicted TPR repeat methyltransferase